MLVGRHIRHMQHQCFVSEQGGFQLLQGCADNGSARSSQHFGTDARAENLNRDGDDMGFLLYAMSCPSAVLLSPPLRLPQALSGRSLALGW
jgi:hypothetical protein